MAGLTPTHRTCGGRQTELSTASVTLTDLLTLSLVLVRAVSTVRDPITDQTQLDTVAGAAAILLLPALSSLQKMKMKYINLSDSRAEQLTGAQSSSSLASLQSGVPSQRQVSGTHWPSDVQVKVEPEQGEQLVSSERSEHS